MEDSKTYYVVVRANVSQKNFSMLHETLVAAMQEAERLAKQTSSPFYVLQTVGYFAPTAPPIEWRPCQ